MRMGYFLLAQKLKLGVKMVEFSNAVSCSECPMAQCIFSRSFLRNVLLMLSPCCKYQSVRKSVTSVSCGQTVRRMNIRFGAKDDPFIRTSGTKNHIRKFHHLPPYFGGDMGSGYGKCGEKKRTKVRLSRPLRQILMFCLHLYSPDIDT
jgi:hypothetical protein